MALLLKLKVTQKQITPLLNGVALAAPTALAALPTLKELQQDPMVRGAKLWAALGGEALQAALETDAERLLLLQCDAAAEGVAWEFALLAHGAQYALLRLVPRRAPVAPLAPQTDLKVVVLGADPLVDETGIARESWLDVQSGLRALRQTLAASGKAVQAARVPPTRPALQAALQARPTVLHLMCQGQVSTLKRQAVAQLLLEDDNGGPQLVPGPDLLALAPEGGLRLVVLAAGAVANGQRALARTLVHNGVPLVVALQGAFPLALSEAWVAAFYRTLLAGQSLAEAVRQARLALLDYPAALGLIVAYTVRGAWGPLAVPEGAPAVLPLDAPRYAILPPEVQPPPMLLGRSADLHALAVLLAAHKKVALVGAGGIGKTALVAALATRFAWRWPKGVRALSLLHIGLDARRFTLELIRLLAGEIEAQRLGNHALADLTQAMLLALRTWDGLLIFDNYELVLQAVAQGEVNALALHSSVAQMAECATHLLFTSREPLTGLDVVNYPPADMGLAGLTLMGGAYLLLGLSARVQAENATGFATATALATEGHPLALALMAKDYDACAPLPSGGFLLTWENDLNTTGQALGVTGEDRTLLTALSRSLRRLPPALQTYLRALSGLAFPFMAEAAARVWAVVAALAGEPPPTEIKETLAIFTQRKLLEIDTYFVDGSPATYRLHPAVRQALAARISTAEQAALQAGYAAYGAWLAQRAYGEIQRDPGLSRVVRASLPVLETAATLLTGTAQRWHLKYLAWLKNAYGETEAAEVLLRQALAQAPRLPEVALDKEAAQVDAGLRYELAKVLAEQGALDEALVLCKESLPLYAALNDEPSQAAVFHQMAQVFERWGAAEEALTCYEKSLTLWAANGNPYDHATTLYQTARLHHQRGDLEQALARFGESLVVWEALGDKSGRAATLHETACVHLQRGALEQAQTLFQTSLQLAEAIGDKKAKATTLNELARVYYMRGALDQAQRLFAESLGLKKELGDKQAAAKTQRWLMVLALDAGDLDRALALCEETLHTARELGDLEGQASALHQRAHLFYRQGALAQALAFFQESLALKAQQGNRRGQATTLHEMARIYMAQGALDQALVLYEESLALSAQVGDQASRAATLTQMASLFMQRQAWGTAEQCLQESWQVSQALGDPQGLAFSGVQLGQVAAARGEVATARRRYEAGLALFEQLGMRRESAQVRAMLEELTVNSGSAESSG